MWFYTDGNKMEAIGALGMVVANWPRMKKLYISIIVTKGSK